MRPGAKKLALSPSLPIDNVLLILKEGRWLLVAGRWLLVAGCWSLVAGRSGSRVAGRQRAIKD